MVVFDSFHRYLGVAGRRVPRLPIHGAWTLLVAIAMLQSSSFDDWLAWPASWSAPFSLGARSSASAATRSTAGLARTIVPIAYTAWSLWLHAAGVVLLI